MGKTKSPLARRFNGYLPVVIDVETGGLNYQTDALLEVAAVMITMTEDGNLQQGATHAYHVLPFEGANLDPEALALNKEAQYTTFKFHNNRPLEQRMTRIMYKTINADMLTQLRAACKREQTTISGTINAATLLSAACCKEGFFG